MYLLKHVPIVGEVDMPLRVLFQWCATSFKIGAPLLARAQLIWQKLVAPLQTADPDAPEEAADRACRCLMSRLVDEGCSLHFY